MSRTAVIVDCETTSLTPNYESGAGVIWELALISRATGEEHLWRMKPDLSVADPAALRAGRFYERTEGMPPYGMRGFITDLARPKNASGIPVDAWSDPVKLAALLAPLLDGAIIVAANPAFDAGFLSAFLRHYGQAPTWHYRLRDIGSMAYGYLRAQGRNIPAAAASTDVFAAALGVQPDEASRHSALGDCRLVAAMLGVIEGGDPA